MLELRPISASRWPHERRRIFAGARVSRHWRTLSAALVACEGHGLDARAQLIAFARQPVPGKLKRLLARCSSFPRARPIATMQASDAIARLLQRLIEPMPAAQQRVLTATVLEPGFWSSRKATTPTSLPMLDTFRLAELSTFTILDGLEQQDRVLEGNGQGLLVLPWWLMLRAQRQTTYVIRLGKTTWATYLPNLRDRLGASAIRHVALAPDPQALASLILSDPNEGPPQIMILGPAEQRARLMEAFQTTHPDWQLCDEQQAGLPIGALSAAATALLGMLHLDQVPANPAEVSGAVVSRVLGRLTPGSPQNWQRVVREIASSKNPLSLRSAI